MNDIREHFAAIQSHRVTIAALEQRQSELAQRIEALADNRRLGELRGRLEDLAAAVELGEQKPVTLSKLRAEISEAEQEAAQTAETRAQLEAAASGLARRLTAARAELTAAEGQSDQVLRAHYRQRFAEALARFEEVKAPALEAWARCAAIAELAGRTRIALERPNSDLLYLMEGMPLNSLLRQATEAEGAELKALGAL